MSRLKDILNQIDLYVPQAESNQPNPDLNEKSLKSMYAKLTGQGRPTYRTMPLAPAPGNHFPKPQDLDHLVSHFFSQLEFSRHTLHPVELAAMAYKRIVDMAPFTDNNEKLAQEFMNHILIAYGYPKLSLPLNLTDGYDTALTDSRTHKDMDIFSEFAAKAVLAQITGAQQ
ncbi:MAG TPA: Fic family protein [Candidatus Scybalocola faecavium]|nr:Fic family protein [Candidatus Scybalocola faecavium]